MPISPFIACPGPGDRARRLPGRALGTLCVCALGAAVPFFASAQLVSDPAPDVPVPLAMVDSAAQAAAGTRTVWEFSLGQSALEGGFHSLAEGYFRSALENPALDENSRRRILLALASALIGQIKATEAAEALDAVPGQRDDPWWVRRGAVDFLQQNFDELNASLDQIDEENLPQVDRATFHFLRALAFDHAGDTGEAEREFEQAFARSQSSAQLALFRLAQSQSRLVSGEASDSLAVTLKRRMEENTGREIGFQFALQYAVVLDLLGRKQEAIDVLARQREILQPRDAELRDRTLLILGLVAGTAAADGRAAFRELVVSGSDRELQRAALLQLAASVPPDGGAGAGQFRQLLDDLLSRTPPHPLTEELLFHRAELALRAREFEVAEADIEALLTRFPGTGLRQQALGILASSSWQRQRFRNAASYLSQIRGGMSQARDRAWLSVLLGESYFRAGMQFGTPEDFRNAAEGYSTAFAEVTEVEAGGEGLPGVTLGTLFFQRVLSAIRGRNADEAAILLDDPAARAGVDTESWWQAEWNLARHLQLTGQFEAAFERVVGLSLAADVPVELRLRFLWLAAQLTVETDRSGETASRVGRVMEFINSPEASDVDPVLRMQVASSAQLLGAQALLSTGSTAAGLVAIETLRSDYPGTRAALYSFIVQARYMAAENRLADAQQLLVNLADANRESEYAPLALYEAALQAERRGQDAFLSEASQLLERLASEYPQERFQFPARLKQADIARKLNQFAAAEQIYRFLENAYPNNPGRMAAQLALADTLLAQADADPAKFEGAVSRLERLAVLPSAPADMRAEAGFKLAHGWQLRGNPDRATQLYWDLYQRFLGDSSRAPGDGTRWRYWVSRALLELGQLEERANRGDNATRLYEAVIEHGLPGGKIARGRLGQAAAGG